MDIIRWTTNTLVILLALSFALAVYKQTAKSVPKPTGDAELAELLHRRRSRWATHRLAVAAVDLRSKEPNRHAFILCDGETPFELGPVSRCLTGLLVADAVERKQIALDQTLASLDAGITGALGEQTVKSLVTHRSGLPPMPWWLAVKASLASLVTLSPWPRKGPDIVRVANRQRVKRPGTYRPSDLGAALSGHLVARAAGGTFAEVLDERVLAPIGMIGTSADPARHKVKRGWTSIGRRAWPWRMDGYAPSAGIVSNLNDMTTLVIALLRGEAPGRKATTPIASTDGGTTAAAKAEPAGTTDSHQIGMLWKVDQVPETGRRRVGHEGQTGGYSAYVAVFPEVKRAVVVLSDTSGAMIVQKLGMQVATWLATRSAGRPTPQPTTKRPSASARRKK